MLKKILKVVVILVIVVLVLAGTYTAYAATTAAGKLAFPDTPYPPLAATTDSATIERGRYLVRGPAHCAACHITIEGRDPSKITPTTPLSGGIDFSMGPIAAFYAANLTPDSATGIGARTDGEIARVLRYGIRHDGTYSFFMRYATGQPSDDDIVAILSYLRSLPPVRNQIAPPQLKLLGKVMLPMFPILVTPKSSAPGVPASAEPTRERGEYLATRVALCVGCHSPMDSKTFLPIAPIASGGPVEASHDPEDADMEFAAPNLTSDPTTGITGKLSEDAFIARLRQPRLYNSSIMPWEQFATMTDSDIRSIYRYLHSLPPVTRDNGPAFRKKGWKPGS